jgi:hypothetical protein
MEIDESIQFKISQLTKRNTNKIKDGGKINFHEVLTKDLTYDDMVFLINEKNADITIEDINNKRAIDVLLANDNYNRDIFDYLIHEKHAPIGDPKMEGYCSIPSLLIDKFATKLNKLSTSDEHSKQLEYLTIIKYFIDVALERGLQIEQEDVGKNALLKKSVDANWEALTKLLLKYDLSLNSGNGDSGYYLVSKAYKNNYSEQTKKFLIYKIQSRLTLDVTDSKNKTLLIKAIEDNNYDLANDLLNAKADPNIYKTSALIELPPLSYLVGLAGKSPLHIAIERNSYNFVELLLKYDVDLNQKDGLFRTPIHTAINKFYQTKPYFSQDEHNPYYTILNLILKAVETKNIVIKDQYSLFGNKISKEIPEVLRPNLLELHKQGKFIDSTFTGEMSGGFSFNMLANLAYDNSWMLIPAIAYRYKGSISNLTIFFGKHYILNKLAKVGALSLSYMANDSWPKIVSFSIEKFVNDLWYGIDTVKSLAHHGIEAIRYITNVTQKWCEINLPIIKCFINDKVDKISTFFIEHGTYVANKAKELYEYIFPIIQEKYINAKEYALFELDYALLEGYHFYNEATQYTSNIGEKYMKLILSCVAAGHEFLKSVATSASEYDLPFFGAKNIDPGNFIIDPTGISFHKYYNHNTSHD